MCIGTMGFEIANRYKPGTTEWDFRTFGTGAGFLADCIVAGTLRTIRLESVDGSCKINLSDGVVELKKGLIKGLNSLWNLDTGEFKSERVVSGSIYDLSISGGKILSKNHLAIQSHGIANLEHYENDGTAQRYNGFAAFEDGNNIFCYPNQHTQITGGTINIAASGGHLKIETHDEYDVYINGYSWKNIINRIEALEIG